MDATATAMTGFALIAGLAIAAVAAWRLRQASPTGGGRNGQLGSLLFSLMVLLNAVPRLAGAPSAVTFALSTLALLPTLGAVLLFARARRG